MTAAAFIAGDWGLSRLRLTLCGASGEILAEREGPGISVVNGMFSDCMAALTLDWEPVPIVLCGMVGSTLGWRLVPYVEAPTSPDELAQAVVSFEWKGRRVMIAPGVRSQSTFGAPDVMRGEETQIAGAMTLRPDLREGDHLLCLPGTHAKWVELSGGAIRTITTAISGELYALLAEHSTLCDGAPRWDGIPNDDFGRGLARSRQVPLLQALFEARARRLTGDLADSRAFLSGLIIGNDVQSAPSGAVVLVGAQGLNALYAEALRGRDVSAICLDGNRCSIAGLAGYHRSNG